MVDMKMRDKLNLGIISWSISEPKVTDLEPGKGEGILIIISFIKND